ncbi:MAG: alpha-amylase/4-alpha-glucanotransferase domain-containing protein, partial [Gemmatimonadaceae bacterium]
YWHGVFGGLYLPHLREAIWRELSVAENYLRTGEAAAVDEMDIDVDGHGELWVHGACYSIIIAPDRGGSIEEFTRFTDSRNFVDTMTRRREPYHELPPPAASPSAVAHKEHAHEGGAGRAPSIHEIEKSLHLTELPPVDLDVRAMLQERILAAKTTQLEVERAAYTPVHSWAGLPFKARHVIDGGVAHVELSTADGVPKLVKAIHVSADGHVGVEFEWQSADFKVGDYFSTELSFSQVPPTVSSDADGTIWWYPVETVAKSERGLDRTRQGMTALVRWPVALGRGTLQIR